MDCSWCLERSELLEAFKRAKQVRLVVRPALAAPELGSCTGLFCGCSCVCCTVVWLVYCVDVWHLCCVHVVLLCSLSVWQQAKQACGAAAEAITHGLVWAGACATQHGGSSKHIATLALARHAAGTTAYMYGVRWLCEPDIHVLSIGLEHRVCIVLQVCEGCCPKLKQMCSKPLPCQHWCCATRGSSSCLPCLQAGCVHQVGSRLDTGTCVLLHVVCCQRSPCGCWVKALLLLLLHQLAVLSMLVLLFTDIPAAKSSIPHHD